MQHQCTLTGCVHVYIADDGGGIGGHRAEDLAEAVGEVVHGGRVEQVRRIAEQRRNTLCGTVGIDVLDDFQL